MCVRKCNKIFHAISNSIFSRLEQYGFVQWQIDYWAPNTIVWCLPLARSAQRKCQRNSVHFHVYILSSCQQHEEDEILSNFAKMDDLVMNFCREVTLTRGASVNVTKICYKVDENNNGVTHQPPDEHTATLVCRDSFQKDVLYPKGRFVSKRG